MDDTGFSHSLTTHLSANLVNLIDNSGDLVYVKGTDGVYLYCNQAYAQLFDRTIEQMSGVSSAELFGDGIGLALDAVDRLVISQKITTVIEEQLPVGPSDKLYLVRRTPLIDGEEPLGILTTLVDISKHQQTRYSLLRAQRAFELSIEQSYGATVHMQVTPLLPIHTSASSAALQLYQNIRLQTMNQTAAEFYGVNRQQLQQGKPLTFADTCIDKDKIIADLEELCHSGLQIEKSISRQVDGERRFYNYKVTPVISKNQLEALIVIFFDITDLIYQRQQVESSLARYQSFIQNTQEGIYRVILEEPLAIDLPQEKQFEHVCRHGYIADCSRELLEIFNSKNINDVIGISIGEHLKESNIDIDFFKQKIIANNFSCKDETLEKKFIDGTLKITSISCDHIKQENKLLEYWLIIRDITEEQLLLRKLEHQSNHDSLTRLPNRKQLHHILKNHPYSDSTTSLLLFDLSHFKDINDSLGHNTGDKVLIEIARRIDKLEENCIAFRLGGDEFVLLHFNSSPYQAARLAGLLRTIISQTINLNGLTLEVDASIGIAMAPQHAQTSSELLRCADIAMYKSKQDAEQYAFYHGSFDLKAAEKLSLASDLRTAIKKSELQLAYQPILDLKTHRIKGFEALTRWQHKQRGAIAPDLFIPLAEGSTSIHDLTDFVLNTALQKLTELNSSNDNFTMAINLSANSLCNKQIAKQLGLLLEKYRVSPQLITLEITENAAMRNKEQAIATLSSLRELGVNIAIDDYGTGYSSLAYIQNLSASTLKVDKAFVSRVLESENDQIIVESTIAMSKRLKMTTVIEGVEDLETLDYLAANGANYAQGYVIAKPMLEKELQQWLVGHEQTLARNLNLRAPALLARPPAQTQ